MKRFLLSLGLVACAVPALARTDVGVSVQVGQPGLYGRVDIGNVPAPPTVLYPQPVVIAPGTVVERRPIYLHVPPGHSRDWRRYCGRYAACGQPVYFVRDDWYREHYYHRHDGYRAPPPPRHGPYDHRGRPEHDHGPEHGHDHGPDHHRDHGR